MGRHKSRASTKREQRASEQVGLEQIQHVSWWDEQDWHVYQGDDADEGPKQYGLVLDRVTKGKK